MFTLDKSLYCLHIRNIYFCIIPNVLILKGRIYNKIKTQTTDDFPFIIMMRVQEEKNRYDFYHHSSRQKPIQTSLNSHSVTEKHSERRFTYIYI